MDEFDYKEAYEDGLKDGLAKFPGSLLDYFAGQALPALLGDPNVEDAPAVAAQLAYAYAREMLAERARREEEKANG